MLAQYPFLNFLTYLGCGLAFWAVSLTIYLRITPLKEGSLIAGGDVAAALSASGAALGLALPIGSLAIHAISIFDMAIWAAASLAVQVFFYFIAARVIRNAGALHVAGNKAVGLVIGTGAVCIGLICAASLSY